MTFALEDGPGAGYLGLFIVLLLAVATVLLIRNMSGRLKRLPASFDEPSEDADVSRPGSDDESASGPTAGA